MSEDVKELKKELAKRKRMAVEIASEIHDIVEDTLWTDAVKMPELSEKLLAAVNDGNTAYNRDGFSKPVSSGTYKSTLSLVFL